MMWKLLTIIVLLVLLAGSTTQQEDDPNSLLKIKLHRLDGVGLWDSTELLNLKVDPAFRRKIKANKIL